MHGFWRQETRCTGRRMRRTLPWTRPMILASGRGLAHALGGRSGRVVQVQRSWGVPGNLDAHSSLMVDQPRKSTSGRRQRARGGGRELRELLRRGADAMRRVCGVAGECKLMRRINKWTFLIHFSDPGTGALGPILWCILPPYGNFGNAFRRKIFRV